MGGYRIILAFVALIFIAAPALAGGLYVSPKYSSDIKKEKSTDKGSGGSLYLNPNRKKASAPNLIFYNTTSVSRKPYVAKRRAKPVDPNNKAAARREKLRAHLMKKSQENRARTAALLERRRIAREAKKQKELAMRAENAQQSGGGASPSAVGASAGSLPPVQVYKPASRTKRPQSLFEGL